MEKVNKYKETFWNVVMVGALPTVVVLAPLFDLCMHCPGH